MWKPHFVESKHGKKQAGVNAVLSQYVLIEKWSTDGIYMSSDDIYFQLLLFLAVN